MAQELSARDAAVARGYRDHVARAWMPRPESKRQRSRPGSACALGGRSHATAEGVPLSESNRLRAAFNDSSIEIIKPELEYTGVVRRQSGSSPPTTVRQSAAPNRKTTSANATRPNGAASTCAVRYPSASRPNPSVTKLANTHPNATSESPTNRFRSMHQVDGPQPSPFRVRPRTGRRTRPTPIPP
jgi:hypothetical protein